MNDATNGEAASYAEAIYTARLLIEPGENPEYERGMTELIADLWGLPEIFLADRAERVHRDILAIDIQRPWNKQTSDVSSVYDALAEHILEGRLEGQSLEGDYDHSSLRDFLARTDESGDSDWEVIDDALDRLTARFKEARREKENAP